MLLGKTAYVKDEKVTGTIPTWDGSVENGAEIPDMLQTRVNMTNACNELMRGFSGDNVDFMRNLDTSKVTNMQNMFYNAPNITTIPQLNTQSVVVMSTMFTNCYKLLEVPFMDTRNVTTMNSMFGNCYALTSVPQFDTSNVIDIAGMFSGCAKITTIPAFDVGKVQDFNVTFNNCSSLKSILMYGMKKSFSISSSTKFEREDLVTILNNLGTVTSTQTLTMGTTNLEKLTEEDKAIATGKGWTLA
jgi:surface protein